MSTEQNKDVVREFIAEVLIGGRLDRIDDLLAPEYMNRSFEVDREAFKGLVAGLAEAVPQRRFDIQELVAEGDSVVLRYTGEMVDKYGKVISLRGLTYYRLENGKIVEDDPITSPELAQQLAPLMAAPPV